MSTLAINCTKQSVFLIAPSNTNLYNNQNIKPTIIIESLKFKIAMSIIIDSVEEQ